MNQLVRGREMLLWGTTLILAATANCPQVKRHPWFCLRGIATDKWGLWRPVWPRLKGMQLRARRRERWLDWIDVVEMAATIITYETCIRRRRQEVEWREPGT